MAELLIELLSEEIPARMQARAAADLERLITEGVGKAGLEYRAAHAYATPRRIALVIKDLSAQQPDLAEERKGPRVGAPDKAIQGFLRSVGLDSVDQCEIREINGNEFYFTSRSIKGRPATEVLPTVLTDAIAALSWPKSMRWSETAYRWVRPLHSAIAIFDGEVLKGAIDLGNDEALPFGNLTFGHRFLASEPISVESYADYERKLRKAKVILDPEERKRIIAKDADKLAVTVGLKVKEDPALLDEVAGLVEWPVVLMGDIDDKFMIVPAEVLSTTMRTHQKYFSLLDKSGQLAPKFIVVANMVARDKGRAIVGGNERVLRARLSDAKFFWDQDRKAPLSSRVPMLNDIIFHEKLGSLGDKVDRVGALAAELTLYIPGADKDKVRSAARLGKADLVTEMVGEFPELQGIMGRYYALHDSESEDVAQAIAEHYSPLGPNDACPTAPVSVAVALADKIDTLVGFFAIGETPTGSRDPYALRRAALGVIRLIVENGLRLPLRQAFSRAQSKFVKRKVHGRLDVQFAATGDALHQQLLDFFADRLKVHLRERGVRHDQINAIFALGGEDDLVRLLARVDALNRFLESEDGGNLLVAYRRAANIVRIEEKKDKARYPGPADENRLAEDEERTLSDALGAVAAEAQAAADRESFADAMAAMARLRAPVDAFFDEVTVNCEDAALRANRLKLLSTIRATMDEVADFSQIEG